MSEPLPPAEHWRNHPYVPRREPKPSWRRFYLILAASLCAGLLAVGGLALWAERADRPDIFSSGVTIIFLTCVFPAAFSLAPSDRRTLPRSPGFVYHAAPDYRSYTKSPLPLGTLGFALLAFAAPSLVALVVLIVNDARAG